MWVITLQSTSVSSQILCDPERYQYSFYLFRGKSESLESIFNADLKLCNTINNEFSTKFAGLLGILRISELKTLNMFKRMRAIKKILLNKRCIIYSSRKKLEKQKYGNLFLIKSFSDIRL